MFGGRWSRINRQINNDFIKGVKFYPITGNTVYNDYHDVKAKIDAVLSSPAAMTIFSLNCDLFSLGEIIIKDLDGNILDEHPLYDILDNPNFFESKEDFLWDYMFWLMIGNANLYIDSKNDYTNNSLYFLNNGKINYPDAMLRDADKIFTSKRNAQNFVKHNIEYIYENGTRREIPYEKIVHFADTTTTTKAWFNAPSKLDALYKVISNSELSLDAKNIELMFNGKYMVAGKVGETDITKTMMMPDEKRDIEHKTLSDNPVTAVRSMVDIKKFVDNLSTDKMDKTFYSDVYTIGRMYNIPKDVIEAYLQNGSTYENKKFATADHVDYSLMPKGNQLLNRLLKYFGFENVTACIDWGHLPFMQVRQLQRYESESKRAEALHKLLISGVNPDDAVRVLGYEFENPINYEQIRNTEVAAATGQGNG